eukprot:1484642-Amphidinium_carterae.1
MMFVRQSSEGGLRCGYLHSCTHQKDRTIFFSILRPHFASTEDAYTGTLSTSCCSYQYLEVAFTPVLCWISLMLFPEGHAGTINLTTQSQPLKTEVHTSAWKILDFECSKSD